jgi:uncharacterized membrane protein
MAKYFKCNVCGFVIEGGKLGDQCPSCGATKEAFESYNLPMAEDRYKKLNLHLHPLAVHFPSALSILIPIFFLLSLIIQDPICQGFLFLTRILAIALPISVGLAALAGRYDGKLRFKRTNTPFLKKKILLAAIFLGISSANAVLLWFYTGWLVMTVVILVLSIADLLCAGGLALIGGQLLDAFIPDK